MSVTSSLASAGVHRDLRTPAQFTEELKLKFPELNALEEDEAILYLLLLEEDGPPHPRGPLRKIGYSAVDPFKRINQIRSEVPFVMTVLAIWTFPVAKTLNCEDIVKAAIKKNGWQVNGRANEFFRTNDGDAAVIKKVRALIRGGRNRGGRKRGGYYGNQGGEGQGGF